MLAGLLFAQNDAEDRPDRLLATLPFAGATLIEHHARQLVAAGASQLIVVACRLPPELLGALSRVARLGAAVDTVRSAGEAAAKLHPLARVLVIADGLVATDRTVAALGQEGGDALLVVGGEQAGRDLERVGGRVAWAGIARLQSQRIAEVAALPRDYAMQSALLRVAEQAGAAHLVLPDGAAGHGHGIAHSERALAEHGRALLSALFADARNWFTRWIVAPAARVALPPLVDRGIAGHAIGAGTGIVAALAGVAIWRDHGGVGTLLALVAALAAMVGASFAALRGEARTERWLAGAAIAIPLASAVLLGWANWAAGGGDGPFAAAIGLALFTGLGERTMTVREGWWGSPAAYLLVIALAALANGAGWGIGLAALYAAATLAAAVERLRERA